MLSLALCMMVAIKKDGLHQIEELKQSQNELEMLHGKEESETHHKLLKSFVIKQELDIILSVLMFLSTMMHFILLSKPQLTMNEQYQVKDIKQFMDKKFNIYENPPMFSLIKVLILKVLGFSDQFEQHEMEYLSRDAMIRFYCRALPAMSGAVIPVLVYSILKTCSIPDLLCLIGGVFSLANSILLTDSRLCGPNSMFIAVSLVSVLILVKFQMLHNTHCLLLGVLLSFSVSLLHYGVVFYGFVLIIVGNREFIIFKDQQLSPTILLKKYTLKMSIVGVLPIIVYVCSYVLYLSNGYKTGGSDQYVSKEFQVSTFLKIHFLCNRK